MILLPTSRVKEEDDAYQQWYGQECVGTSGAHGCPMIRTFCVFSWNNSSRRFWLCTAVTVTIHPGLTTDY